MGGADQASVFAMPDVGLVDMAHLDSIRLLDESDPRSMDIQKDLTPSPAPALKEPISRVGKRNGRITTSKNYKRFSVEIRPPRWDTIIWINAVDHQAAQYVADAVLHYVGRPPFRFPGADFRYPPLSLNTGEYLTTREECSAYVAKIAKGSALRCIREEYKVHVKKLVLDAVKSPEVVQFLNSVRKSQCQVPHVDASKCGNLVLEAANSESETYSTPVVDVEEEHWKPRGFDVKEAAVLPCVKQYFRDDHDLDVSLLPSSSTEEDDKGGEGKKRVHSIKSFADFKPSKVDSCIAPSVRPPFFLFGQDVTNDQDLPHSIPGLGAVGTPEIKQRVKHPVVADLSFSADCLEETDEEPGSESKAMDVPTDEEVLIGESGASLESHTETGKADSHGPRTEPSRKRSAASAFDEDSLFAKIRPFVNQQIEEALLPLMSALRSREEDEHKHRQKMLALEQEKLALMRQKLECTRRSNAVPSSVAELSKPSSGNLEAGPPQSGTPSTGELPRPEASLDRRLT